MSRNDRARRLARKARRLREQEAQERAAQELRLNPTPINHSRVRQLFSNMSFRSHEKGGSRPFKDYVVGPTVLASNPTELRARVEPEKNDESYVEEALKQTPS